MIEDKIIERLYWTIPEVAKDLGESASCVRYWISEFKVDVPPHLNKPKVNADNREKIREIYNLLRVEGYTIAGAKRRLG